MARRRQSGARVLEPGREPQGRGGTDAKVVLGRETGDLQSGGEVLSEWLVEKQRHAEAGAAPHVLQVEARVVDLDQHRVGAGDRGVEVLGDPHAPALQLLLTAVQAGAVLKGGLEAHAAGHRDAGDALLRGTVGSLEAPRELDRVAGVQPDDADAKVVSHDGTQSTPRRPTDESQPAHPPHDVAERILRARVLVPSAARQISMNTRLPAPARCTIRVW